MSTDGRERLLDWRLDEKYTKDQDKDVMRAEIAQLTEEFLAGGGEIQQIPYDWAAELTDRAASRVMYGIEGETSGFVSEDNPYGLDDDDIVTDFDSPYV